MQLTSLTKKSFKGFTLIELLVVIAIIGLLSTIVAAPVQSARKKAKDTKKIAELKQIESGLAQYANDNGQYPASSTFLGLAPQYLQKVPSGFTVSNTRDRYLYTAYRGIAPGVKNTASTSYPTVGYHLGTALEVYNPVLAEDDDCIGFVSGTSTGGFSGNKNGGACQDFVFQNPAFPDLPMATGTAAITLVGTIAPTYTAAGITYALLNASTTGIETYAYAPHPALSASAADFQGRGVTETSTSTCGSVIDCIYDVSDKY